MGDFKLKINMTQYIPDFSAKEFDPLASEIAEMIANDARKNIRNQVDVDGNPFTPLAKKTIRNKIASKSIAPNMALIDKGIMLNAIHVFKGGAGKYAVGVMARGKPPRDLVALIHHEQGVNQFTRIIRQFLGISERRQRWIDARINRFVAAVMRKSKKKTKSYRS